MLIDASKWDGSDFFMVWPLPLFIFVTDRVVRAIHDSRLTGGVLKRPGDLDFSGVCGLVPDGYPIGCRRSGHTNWAMRWAFTKRRKKLVLVLRRPLRYASPPRDFAKRTPHLHDLNGGRKHGRGSCERAQASPSTPWGRRSRVGQQLLDDPAWIDADGLSHVDELGNVKPACGPFDLGDKRLLATEFLGQLPLGQPLLLSCAFKSLAHCWLSCDDDAIFSMSIFLNSDKFQSWTILLLEL